MFVEVSKKTVSAWIGMCLVAVPAMLASAELEASEQRWVSSSVFFENANACKWAGMPDRICQSGYRSAYRQHVRITPAYQHKTDCEADFVAGECVVSEVSGLWAPWLSGFSLITQAQLPSSSRQSQRQTPMQHLNRSWWQHLQGATQSAEATTQVRYFSEPLYWERDHQGAIRLTTLREKLRNGEQFAHAFIRRPPVQAGSALWTRQLARLFEPQRLVDVAAP
ncbi:DUF1190 domain-containing protein [Pseudomonas sp. NPDC087358]|uniref:DUF1190 domain-containing protein n=1 Tax=Pseudomonas sp. NPDC087358 TaxID=3364439 RepID=UPI00384E5707